MTEREFDRGWRAGVKAAAAELKKANVSPENAKAHWANAGGALLYLLDKDALKPKDPRRA